MHKRLAELKSVGKSKLNDWTVVELQNFLRDVGEPYSYPKPELITRILRWKKQQTNKEKEKFLEDHPTLNGNLEVLSTICKIPRTSKYLNKIKLITCNFLLGFIRLTNCKKQHLCQEGSELDHIVELQLIKAFVETTKTCVSAAFIQEMNEKINFQVIGQDKNTAKGKIVHQRISGQRTNTYQWKKYKSRMIRVIEYSKHAPKGFIEYLNKL